MTVVWVAIYVLAGLLALTGAVLAVTGSPAVALMAAGGVLAFGAAVASQLIPPKR